MTLTIELTAEEELKLKRAAESKGITIETAVHDLISQQPMPLPAPPSDEGVEEWILRFDEWVLSHKGKFPILSDYALSRESIYTREDELAP